MTRLLDAKADLDGPYGVSSTIIALVNRVKGVGPFRLWQIFTINDYLRKGSHMILLMIITCCVVE